MSNLKRKIRIGINGRCLTQPVTGVQRYGIELLKKFDHFLDTGAINSEQYEIIVFTPREDLSYLDFTHLNLVSSGRLTGNLWEQIELPLLSRGMMLFNPANIAPILRSNQIVTLHDASVFAVPEAYSWMFQLKYRLIMRIMGRFAKKVFTVSNFSKLELIRYCNIRPEIIVVIPSGADHILTAPADPSIFKRQNIKKPYLLAVGSNSLHKNFKAVINALSIIRSDIDFEMVIVGGSFSRVFRSTEEDELPEQVHRVGYVTDPELRALYENALGFVFPSLYEGFGFPPLEAMICGCPVILSAVTSLPEVGGDAVLYCDPHSDSSIAEQMERLLLDEDLRNQLKQKGIIQARKFNWCDTAWDTWNELAISAR